MFIFLCRWCLLAFTSKISGYFDKHKLPVEQVIPGWKCIPPQWCHIVLWIRYDCLDLGHRPRSKHPRYHLYFWFRKVYSYCCDNFKVKSVWFAVDNLCLVFSDVRPIKLAKIRDELESQMSSEHTEREKELLTQQKAVDHGLMDDSKTKTLWVCDFLFYRFFNQQFYWMFVPSYQIVLLMK